MEVVAESGRNPYNFILNSLHIGGATTFGDISERVIQVEERRRPDACEAYTRNIVEYWRRVSRKLEVANVGSERRSEGQIGVGND